MTLKFIPALLVIITLGWRVFALNYTSEIVADTYANDFDNFNKVLRLINETGNTTMKARYTIDLYAVMSKAQHSKAVLYAIPLYSLMENVINSSSNKYFSELESLRRKRNHLYSDTILHSSTTMLDTANLINPCKPIDYPFETNKTAEELIIVEAVRKALDSLPFEELVQKVFKFSKYIRQNDISLCVLCINKMQQNAFDPVLEELKKDPNYEKKVPPKINGIREHIRTQDSQFEAQTQTQSMMCLHQKNDDGFSHYINECGNNNFDLCLTPHFSLLHVRPIDIEANGFILEMDSYTPTIRKYVTMLQKSDEIEPGINKNIVDLDFGNVFDRTWNFRFEGDRVVVLNEELKKYICGGNKTVTKDQFSYIYTRDEEGFNVHGEECTWYFDCKPEPPWSRCTKTTAGKTIQTTEKTIEVQHEIKTEIKIIGRNKNTTKIEQDETNERINEQESDTTECKADSEIKIAILLTCNATASEIYPSTTEKTTTQQQHNNTTTTTIAATVVGGDVNESEEIKEIVPKPPTKSCRCQCRCSIKPTCRCKKKSTPKPCRCH